MQFIQMRQELGLIIAFILMFVADLFLSEKHRKLMNPIACLLLVIQMFVCIKPEEVTLFGGMYHSSEIASVLKTILSVGTLIVFLQSNRWLERPDAAHKTGEFYTLSFSTLIGMYFMVSSGHFLLFFLGLDALFGLLHLFPGGEINGCSRSGRSSGEDRGGQHGGHQHGTEGNLS